MQAIRNDYDATGRLVSHTDAFGNVINYTHNIGIKQEIVTDQLGNITVNSCDNDGNIVQVTDALGGITARTYDGRGNLLSETDALGNTSVYTYDASNNRLSVTDPLGNITRYTYGNFNNVLTVTDPLGHITANTCDPKGNHQQAPHPRHPHREAFRNRKVAPAPVEPTACPVQAVTIVR